MQLIDETPRQGLFGLEVAFVHPDSNTVRTADGTVHAMIGDVCGHGPDEAALGVELRIAWRALTFAGLCGDELLGTLQKVLDNERPSEEIFATLCTVDISPDGRSAGVCLAGHPSPLVAGAGGSGAAAAAVRRQRSRARAACRRRAGRAGRSSWAAPGA